MQSSSTFEINIDQSRLKHVNVFKYPGTMLLEDGRCEKEIRSRIALSKQAFNKLRNILTKKNLSYQIIERVLQCSVYPVLTYGYEAWVMSKAVEKTSNYRNVVFSKDAKDSMDSQAYQ